MDSEAVDTDLDNMLLCVVFIMSCAFSTIMSSDPETVVPLPELVTAIDGKDINTNLSFTQSTSALKEHIYQGQPLLSVTDLITQTKKWELVHGLYQHQTTNNEYKVGGYSSIREK